MSKSTSEIVYEQAVRAVEKQVQQLDELHTRAAVVLAAAGVVTGFLARAVADDSPGGFGYLGLAAFVAAALLCIGVLTPQWDAWGPESPHRQPSLW